MRDSTRAGLVLSDTSFASLGHCLPRLLLRLRTTTHAGMCNVASAGSRLKIILSPKKTHLRLFRVPQLLSISLNALT